MIADLGLLGRSFEYRWGQLSDEDRKKAVPSTVIAGWIGKDVGVVDILMTLLEWQKVTLAGKTYWVEGNTYEEFLKGIEGHLYF